MSDLHTSKRVSRILNLFLVSLLLILLRVWYLSVIQYEVHFKESRKPQRRTIIEPIERATIRDRFNLPLALNKIQYNAAISYADIRQISGVRWEKDPDGRPKKISLRKSYIEELSQFLARELHLDVSMIEDLIHGKASLFPHTPFVIKDDISEAQYMKLKLLEKDWPGIQMQRVSRRVYPMGKCACDVIGYLGAINQTEYLKIAQEMQMLKNYLNEREEGKMIFLPKGYSSPLEVRRRLKELEERAYTINDLVGKSGVEAAFDQTLRGVYGKKTLEVDQKGNCLRELPGCRPALSGDRLILSISAELQLEAEQLLAEYEVCQDARDKARPKERRHPWMRGSSIVAMHPKTGEILALASYPRFDPNDFVLACHPVFKAAKSSDVRHWLENESHIGEIWDGKRPLERELFSDKTERFYLDTRELTWQEFIHTILSEKSEIRRRIESIQTVEEALRVQEEKTEHPLVIDLMSLIARPEDIPSHLREQIGSLSLSSWRLYNQIACRHRSAIRAEMRTLFHQVDFKKWRQEHFKEFLKLKRSEERTNRKYAKPYTDYLEMEEQCQFQSFWQANRLLFLFCFTTGQLPPSCQLQPYLLRILDLRASLGDPQLEELASLLTKLDTPSQLHLLKAWRSFEELKNPLAGRYHMLRNEHGVQLEKHLASAFYPSTGFGYGRSQAFRQSTPLGSVFKLIPSYAAMRERIEDMKEKIRNFEDLTFFTLIDESRSGSMKVMGRFDNGEIIPRHYKGGRLPRSSHSVGRINLMEAIETSSNIYFSILCGDYLRDPAELNSYASLFGLGVKTGIDLPGEFPGSLPQDISNNKSGIYSYAIGQHSLVVTPLQTAVMLSTFANKGTVLKPQIVKLTAGKQRVREVDTLFFQNDFPYREPLSLVGISFPLFTQSLTGNEQGHVSVREPEVKSTAPMPDLLWRFLIESMRRVTNGTRGSARLSAIPRINRSPKAMNAYQKLAPQIIGKTGTAEIMYKQTIDPDTPAEMEKHVWFGGIAYADSTLQEPELVVVVYLRFGNSGKEGAPIAARIVEKWREILTKHQN